METVAVLFFLGFVALQGGRLLWEDLQFIRRRKILAAGTVTGHRTGVDDGQYYNSYILFLDEDGTTHEFTDIIDRAKPTPNGSHVAVVYPEGRPTLARVPRPFVRAAIYLLVFGLAGLLAAKALGLFAA